MRTRHSRGFTIIELLVVIAVIALLMGILVPALGGGRRTAKIAACVANVGSIATAMENYTRENRQVYPTTSGNFDKLRANNGNDFFKTYLSAQKNAVRCPLDTGGSGVAAGKTMFEDKGTSYVYLGGSNATDGIFPVQGHRTTEFPVLSSKFVVGDAIALTSSFPVSNTNNRWHNNTEPLEMTVGFADTSAGSNVKRKTGSELSGGSIDSMAAHHARYY